MELEIDSAFVKAGVSESDAKLAVESIGREIDIRYSLHPQQFVTRGDVEHARKDIAEVKASVSESEARLLCALTDMQRWTIMAMVAAVGLFATITKVLH